MNTCLSRSDLVKLMAGDGDAEFLQNGFAHLQCCEKCRTEAKQLPSFEKGADLLDAGLRDATPCLEYEQFASLLDGSMNAADETKSRQHLAECDSCTANMEYLSMLEARSQFREHKVYEPRTKPVRTWSAFWAPRLNLAAMTAAALLLVVIGSHQMFGPGSRQVHNGPLVQLGGDRNAIGGFTSLSLFTHDPKSTRENLHSIVPGKVLSVPKGVESRLQFIVKQTGWVYVFQLSSDGKLQRLQVDNPVIAGQVYSIPLKAQHSRAAGIPSKSTLYMVFSDDSQKDLENTGFTQNQLDGLVDRGHSVGTSVIKCSLTWGR